MTYSLNKQDAQNILQLEEVMSQYMSGELFEEQDSSVNEDEERPLYLTALMPEVSASYGL